MIVELLKLAAEVVAVVIGVAAVAYVVSSSVTVISDWLRANGLDKSVLMSALVFLDQFGSMIRRTIRVKTKSQQEHTIESEKELTEEEKTKLPPEVLKSLNQTQHATIDITSEL